MKQLIENLGHQDSEPILEGKTLKLFELTPEEKERLRLKIAEHNGLIRIFVHPDYLNYANYYKEDPEKAASLKKYEEVFRRILRSPSEKNPPALIIHGIAGGSLDLSTYAEKFDRIIQGKEWESVSQDYQTYSDIYVIPASSTNPTPFIKEATTVPEPKWKIGMTAEEARGMWAPYEKAWEILAETLRDLGVKKILIGGNELYVSGKFDEPKDSKFDIMEHVGGCVGLTIQELRAHGFEIELSILTSPEGRKEIREKTWSFKRS